MIDVSLVEAMDECNICEVLTSRIMAKRSEAIPFGTEAELHMFMTV